MTRSRVLSSPRIDVWSSSSVVLGLLGFHVERPSHFDPRLLRSLMTGGSPAIWRIPMYLVM